jgi:hypothetical protein
MKITYEQYGISFNTLEKLKEWFVLNIGYLSGYHILYNFDTSAIFDKYYYNNKISKQRIFI